jgi:hypothetical protein
MGNTWTSEPDHRYGPVATPRQRTFLPHRPGWWLVHTHNEGQPCDLSVGGCRYEAGLWLRVKAWMGWRRG